MADPVAPEHGCPPCPRCHLTLGTPIAEAQVERFEGPPSSTLFCPACGAGWVGGAEQLAQARKAWAAYEATLTGGRTPNEIADAIAKETGK